ncbi:anthrax toxin lethal factor-related metalloendopeptidase [Kosakonia cowanii]|uniref:anthrax toxin lethal factor-related metalloendopeptidase n=1 Tax=Kosakonia cowanii TaxID=208223 RepID=UPI00398197E7
MYAYAKEKARPQNQGGTGSSSEDEAEDTARNLIAKQARRAGLAKSLQTYQQVFQAIYNVHGGTVYKEIWYALGDTVPLNSTAMITAEHMAAIADFIVAREKIVHSIFTSTTPDNIPMDVTKVKDALQKIPFPVLNKAISLGQFITATNDNITNHAGRRSLKNVTPRGWAQGQTWSSVPGIGAIGKMAAQGIHPDETIVSLSKDKYGEWVPATNHSSTNLVLHEYAHAIDRSFGEKGLMGPKGTGEAGDYLSKRASFIAAWEKDLGNTTPESFENYYWQGGTSGGAEEAFAEGFSDLYGKTEYRKWPNIKAYLARKMKSVT